MRARAPPPSPRGFRRLVKYVNAFTTDPRSESKNFMQDVDRQEANLRWATADLTRLQEVSGDADAAERALEELRWPPDGVPDECPKCGRPGGCYRSKTRDGRDGRLRCRLCSSHFSVRTGSPLSDRQMPLHRICFALHLSQTCARGDWEARLIDADFADLTAKRLCDWLSEHAVDRPLTTGAPEIPEKQRSVRWRSPKWLLAGAALAGSVVALAWMAPREPARAWAGPPEDGSLIHRYSGTLEGAPNAVFRLNIETTRSEGDDLEDWRSKHDSIVEKAHEAIQPR